MMKFLLFFSILGGAYSAYIFDLLKPALDAGEVNALLANKATAQWPTFSNIPDDVDFDCSSKPHSGFYADPKFQCQVFHRCDVNGNLTSYLCVNTTLFNQLTLTCDYYYNVDCGRFTQFESFANSRLYTDKELFDSPPADYVSSHVQEPAVSASPASVKPTNKSPASRATTKPVATSVATEMPTEEPVSATETPVEESTAAPETESSASDMESPAPTVQHVTVTAVTKKGPIRVGGSVSVGLSSRNGEANSGSASAFESASNV